MVDHYEDTSGKAYEIVDMREFRRAYPDVFLKPISYDRFLKLEHAAAQVEINAKRSIETVDGQAFYIKTVTAKKWDWNDIPGKIKDGFVVLHEGHDHHIYKIKAKGAR